MTEQNDIEFQQVTGAFRAIVGLITAADPIIEGKLKAGSAAVVVVPRRQVNQVVGKQGAIVKALQGYGALVQQHKRFVNFDMVLQDPVASESREDPDAEPTSENVEARLETFLNAAGYNGRVQVVAMESGSTVFIGSTGEPVDPTLKELVDAGLHGLNRNYRHRYSVTWREVKE